MPHGDGDELWKKVKESSQGQGEERKQMCILDSAAPLQGPRETGHVPTSPSVRSPRSRFPAYDCIL